MAPRWLIVLGLTGLMTSAALAEDEPKPDQEEIPGLGKAQMTCADVPPIFQEATFTRVTEETACAPEDLAVIARIEAAQVCYQTGMEGSWDAEIAALSGTRVVRMRRGSEVIEKIVPRQPRLREILDVRTDIDTVALRLRGVMCVAENSATFESGSWEMRGEDRGTSFSAAGFLPTEMIGVTLDRGDALMTFSFDIPDVHLMSEATPRQIAGVLRLPVH